MNTPIGANFCPAVLFVNLRLVTSTSISTYIYKGFSLRSDEWTRHCGPQGPHAYVSRQGIRDTPRRSAWRARQRVWLLSLSSPPSLLPPHRRGFLCAWRLHGRACGLSSAISPTAPVPGRLRLRHRAQLVPAYGHASQFPSPSEGDSRIDHQGWQPSAVEMFWAQTAADHRRSDLFRRITKTNIIYL